MNGKKGALTTYIIIGIIILAAGMFLMSVNGAIKYSVGESYSLDSVPGVYQICGEIALKNVLTKIGLHGGYYIVPENRKAADIGLAYWYNERPYFLSASDVENEIIKGLYDELQKQCGDVPSKMAKYGINLELKDSPSVSVSINENEVTSAVDMKWTGTIGQIQKTSSTNMMKQDVALNRIIEYGKEIALAYENTGNIISFADCTKSLVLYPYKDIIIANISGFINGNERYSFLIALKNKAKEER